MSSIFLARTVRQLSPACYRIPPKKHTKWSSAGLGLVQWHKRWANIGMTLGWRLVLTGLSVHCTPFSHACKHMSLCQIVYICFVCTVNKSQIVPEKHLTQNRNMAHIIKLISLQCGCPEIMICSVWPYKKVWMLKSLILSHSIEIYSNPCPATPIYFIYFLKQDSKKNTRFNEEYKLTIPQDKG